MTHAPASASTAEPCGYSGLFSPQLISPEVAESLPPSYTIRALEKADFHRGFLDVLRVLTKVGDVSEERWNERYEWMDTQGKGGYFILVVHDGERIVATGALIVERKLYVLICLSLCFIPSERKREIRGMEL